MHALTRSTVGLAFLVLLPCCAGGPASQPAASTSAAAFSCRLPVITYNKNGTGASANQNGFIAVPSGAFTPDSTGDGGTYDWAYRRWVPTLRSYLLADGSAYVDEQQAPDGHYEIHMVQVASGADKVILRMPYDNAYSILALKPEGIYLVPLLHRSGVPQGLWVLSSTTAAITEVPGAGGSAWRLIEAGAAWGGPVGVDRLDRLDLSTGVVTTWFQHPVEPPTGIGSGYGPEIIAFDRSRRPLVELYPPPAAGTTPLPELWVVSGPGQATKLAGMPLPDQFLQPGVTDTHGTWIVGSDGFYLYTEAELKRAGPMPPGPVGTLVIAGECT
jgi:hypothetical protein